MAVPRVLVLVLGLAFAAAFVKAQNGATECDSDTMAMCRKNIQQIVQGDGNGRTVDHKDLCWRIRLNFDCMLWQTSMCVSAEEQDKNSDIILKAWRYMEGFCERYKNWWTKSCFQTKGLERCENMLSSRSLTADNTACRSYVNFRECATLEIQKACSSDDHRLLGVYLMEKGQQRAWKCPKDSRERLDPVNAPLASDTSEVSSRDIMYSDSIFKGKTCIYDAESHFTQCLKMFEDVQRHVKDMADDLKRETKLCCAVEEYRSCVERTFLEECKSDNNELVEKLISSLMSRLVYKCDDVNMETCSGCMRFASPQVLLFVTLLIAFALSYLPRSM